MDLGLSQLSKGNGVTSEGTGLFGQAVLTGCEFFQLLLQRDGGIVRTEHLGCQALHEILKMLIQNTSLEETRQRIYWDLGKKLYHPALSGKLYDIYASAISTLPSLLSCQWKVRKKGEKNSKIQAGMIPPYEVL